MTFLHSAACNRVGVRGSLEYAVDASCGSQFPKAEEPMQGAHQEKFELELSLCVYACVCMLVCVCLCVYAAHRFAGGFGR
jgi:hypothetical protein